MAKNNSVNDEIKRQHKYVKEELDFKGKVKYFFYYYKVHTAVTLLVMAVIIYMVHFYVTKKDPVLQVAIVNGYPQMELSEMIAVTFAQLGPTETILPTKPPSAITFIS